MIAAAGERWALVIVGGDAAAVVAGMRASTLGYRCCLTEKDRLGGACSPTGLCARQGPAARSQDLLAAGRDANIEAL